MLKKECEVLFILFDEDSDEIEECLRQSFESVAVIDYEAVDSYWECFSELPKVVVLYEMNRLDFGGPKKLEFPGKKGCPVIYVCSSVDFDLLSDLVQEINLECIVKTGETGKLIKECGKILYRMRWEKGARDFIKGID